MKITLIFFFGFSRVFLCSEMFNVLNVMFLRSAWKSRHGNCVNSSECNELKVRGRLWLEQNDFIYIFYYSSLSLFVYFLRNAPPSAKIPFSKLEFVLIMLLLNKSEFSCHTMRSINDIFQRFVYESMLLEHFSILQYCTFQIETQNTE